MTVSYPYPLAWLSQKLRVTDAKMVKARNDESSTNGGSHVWSAALSEPFWRATVPLAARSDAEARDIDAAVDLLIEENEAMLFSDPSYQGIDEMGATVAGFAANRTAITIAGLSSGCQIKRGQRLTCVVGDYVWLASFGEDATADEAGALGPVTVHPYPPLTLATGAEIELKAPYCKMKVEARDEFTYSPASFGQGGSITLIQQ